MAMTPSTAAFRLDDSPVKVGWASMRSALVDEEDSLHLMSKEPFSSAEIDSFDVEQDPQFRVLCMKKEGHGSKLFKIWVSGLPMAEVVQALDDYKLFKLCQPRVMVAGDVLESLEMRLCYHLHNSQGLQEAIVAMKPKCEPFKSYALPDLSYKTMVWFHFRKEEATKKGSGGGWVGTQKAWLEYAMGFVELSYVDDLVSRGYILGDVSREEVAAFLRCEMGSYLTCLKQPRNNAGHVFSTAIKQDESNTLGRAPSRPKVRDLLDVPVPDLSEDSRKSLLDMIDHFFNFEKLPDHLKDLRWSFSLQLSFLKDVLQKGRSMEHLTVLLQKKLRPSDVGHLGRIILPKKEAEERMPSLATRGGVSIQMEDFDSGHAWNLRYRLWPNNKSRMYILENTAAFVISHGLVEGGLLVIYRIMHGGYLLRGMKKKDGRLDIEPVQEEFAYSLAKGSLGGQPSQHGNGPLVQRLYGGSPSVKSVKEDPVNLDDDLFLDEVFVSMGPSFEFDSSCIQTLERFPSLTLNFPFEEMMAVTRTKPDGT